MKKFFTFITAALFAVSMNAITVAEALQIAGELEQGASTEEEYEIEGYVTAYAGAQADTDGGWSQYQNQIFWIADEAGTAASNADGALEVYQGVPTEMIYVGDKVKVTAKLTNYNGLLETVKKAPVEILEKVDRPEQPEEEVGDVVFTGADFLGQGTATSGSEVTATIDGVTFACDKGYSDDEHSTLRCYKTGVITITSETEQIGKLVFKFFSTYTGDLNTTVVVNAKEWSYTLPSQARIEKVSVFFGEFEPEPEPEPEVTPEVPEGVLTCAGAVEFAATVPEEPTAEQKEVEVGDVVVRGFVSFCYDLKPGETQQSAWLADLKSAKAGVVQAFYANVTEAVAKGDYVEATGKLVKYFKAGKDGKPDEIILEIKNGDMKKVDPLAVENVFTTVKAQKVMMNGTLYIIRGNKMFDVRGAQVR